MAEVTNPTPVVKSKTVTPLKVLKRTTTRVRPRADEKMTRLDYIKSYVNGKGTKKQVHASRILDNYVKQLRVKPVKNNQLLSSVKQVYNLYNDLTTYTTVETYQDFRQILSVINLFYNEYPDCFSDLKMLHNVNEIISNNNDVQKFNFINVLIKSGIENKLKTVNTQRAMSFGNIKNIVPVFKKYYSNM